MVSEFEICGNHIPYESITDYCIIQREYIYRPSFIETHSKNKLIKALTSPKYRFDRMLPYAMILCKDDIDFKEASKNVLVKDLGLSVIKDVTVGVLSIVGDKINKKRFRCLNIADRKFTTFLSDIPAVVVKSDGRILDVYRDDPVYNELGQGIETSTMIVPVLKIKTKEKEYFFFGNDIQFHEIGAEYTRLRFEMETYKEEALKLQNEKKRLEMEAKANILSNLLPGKIISNIFNNKEQVEIQKEEK